MEKIEYPKWIYHETLPALIVKSREEHLVKQREGYFERIGKEIKFIEDAQKIKDAIKPQEEKTEEEKVDAIFNETKKRGRPPKGK